MQSLVRPLGKVPHVAIVGAGIAGLRCADVLIHNGARVTIFEARNRVGGRVGFILVKCYLRLIDMRIGSPGSIRWLFNGHASLLLSYFKSANRDVGARIGSMAAKTIPFLR